MAAESWLIWALIAGMALIAFLTRAVFILPGSHLRLPPTAERVLRYAPAAVTWTSTGARIASAASGGGLRLLVPKSARLPAKRNEIAGAGGRG